MKGYDMLATHLRQLPSYGQVVKNSHDKYGRIPIGSDNFLRRKHAKAVNLVMPDFGIVVEEAKWLNADFAKSPQGSSSQGAGTAQDDAVLGVARGTIKKFAQTISRGLRALGQQIL